MAVCDDVFATGGGDEILADGCSIIHGTDFEAIVIGLEGFDGIDFCNDDFGAETFGTHGNTTPAITVACDYNGGTRNEGVGSLHDGIPYRLASTVAVIVIVLASGIVDVEHREG